MLRMVQYRYLRGVESGNVSWWWGRVFYFLFFNCPGNESCGNIKGGASQEGRGGQEWEESVFFRHPDKERLYCGFSTAGVFAKRRGPQKGKRAQKFWL